MKCWAGFIMLDGRIEAKEVKTKDFNRMEIPKNAIGCMLISLREPMRLGRPLIESLEISPVTYFGEKNIPPQKDVENVIWIKTRLGTYMQIESTAKVIKLEKGTY